MSFSDLTPTPVYDTYWKFAARRQEIFYNRMENKAFPWTDDEILRTYKFTNAYRASDRVSQYLIRNIIYVNDFYSPEDQCFRILLFKLFNKIETWEYLKECLGEISYKAYDYKVYDELLMKKLEGSRHGYLKKYMGE